MTPDSFIAFLSAYVELNPNTPPTAAQWAIINAKLDRCFDKRTPDRAVGVIHGSGPNGALLGTVGAPTTCDPNAKVVGVLTGTGDFTKITGNFISVTC